MLATGDRRALGQPRHIRRRRLYGIRSAPAAAGLPSPCRAPGLDSCPMR